MKNTVTPTPLDLSAPIHKQIMRDLHEWIDSGLYKVGDRLPSEAELKRMYDVSRTPIRQALNSLQSEGYILRAQGRGSFVSERKIGGVIGPMQGFGDVLRSSGHMVEPRTLFVDEIPANEEVSQSLKLVTGIPVTKIGRLFIVDGEPLVVFHHYVPSSLLAEPISDNDFPSFHGLMRARGHDPEEALQSIGATLLEGDISTIMATSDGSPGLAVVQTYMSASEEPLWVSFFWIRADRYQFHVRLVRK